MTTMADLKSARRRDRVEVPDLAPKKEVRGGGSSVLHLNEPPLPIPPPGFVVSEREQEPNE
jgi:hypothetical protein